jgi:hypothetical protein
MKNKTYSSQEIKGTLDLLKRQDFPSEHTIDLIRRTQKEYENELEMELLPEVIKRLNPKHRTFSAWANRRVMINAENFDEAHALVKRLNDSLDFEQLLRFRSIGTVSFTPRMVWHCIGKQLVERPTSLSQYELDCTMNYTYTVEQDRLSEDPRHTFEFFLKEPEYGILYHVSIVATGKTNSVIYVPRILNDHHAEVSKVDIMLSDSNDLHLNREVRWATFNAPNTIKKTFYR